jgi:hypothetical protein
MKKLARLQSEKNRLTQEIEHEEQLVESVRQSKVDLAEQLEAEQENVVHRLQRQISVLHGEKRCVFSAGTSNNAYVRGV